MRKLAYFFVLNNLDIYGVGGKKMNNREGKLDIGLDYYQEEQWLSALRLYGTTIMDKSLLSAGQKEELIKESDKRASLQSY